MRFAHFPLNTSYANLILLKYATNITFDLPKKFDFNLKTYQHLGQNILRISSTKFTMFSSVTIVSKAIVTRSLLTTTGLIYNPISFL